MAEDKTDTSECIERKLLLKYWYSMKILAHVGLLDKQGAFTSCY